MDKPEASQEIKRQLLEYLMELMDKNEGSRVRPMSEPMVEEEEMIEEPVVEAEMVVSGEEAEDLLKRLKSLGK